MFINIAESWASNFYTGFKLFKWGRNHWRSDANSWCNIE